MTSLAIAQTKKKLKSSKGFARISTKILAKILPQLFFDFFGKSKYNIPSIFISITGSLFNLPRKIKHNISSTFISIPDSFFNLF